MQIDETKQHKKLGSSDDDDDDALMRVISVCFPNVFSFLWLNHLISLIMTDKKSVVSTPAFPDLNCVWSLVSTPLKTTDEDNTDVRDHDEDSVDVQVTDDQAERDDSPGWRRERERWGNSLNQHSHWAGQTLAKTLDTTDKLAPAKSLVISEYLGSGGWKYQFPMCEWGVVVLCHLCHPVSRIWLIQLPPDQE